MCIVLSIIEHVYWYSRVTLLSMFVYESLYVSFPIPSILYIHFVLEWETDNLLLGHCLFNHYIHWWCDFTPYFDLSWLSFFFICSLFRHHTHYCFQFIPFVSPLVLFLQQPIPSLLFSLHHSYTSHY